MGSPFKRVAHLHVATARIRHRFAIVKSLEFREFIAMLLEKVTDAPDDARTLAWRNLRPRPGFEGSARCGYRQVDIGLLPGRHMSNEFFGRRIFHWQGLATFCRNPLPIDQDLVFLVEEGGGLT